MFDHNVLKKARVIFPAEKKQRLMLKQKYSRDGFILAEEIYTERFMQKSHNP